MTKNEAVSIIRKSALAPYSDELVPALRPSARIHPSRKIPANNTVSRFGGVPSLPSGVPWPTWKCTEFLDADIQRNQQMLRRVPPTEDFADLLRNGIDELRNLQEKGPLPLVFLGQINLADLSGYAVRDFFPPSGMLWFFCDMFKQPWGFDPATFGAWRCIYGESESLRMTAKPQMIPEHWMRPATGLRVIEEWTLPPVLLMRSKIFARESDPEYDGICEQLSPSKEPIYRLGGWPQEAGEDMRLEIQLAANGIFCGDPSALRHPRRKSLEPGAKDWSLLLQLDSGGEMDWYWGDMGRVYFWCRSQDMARGEFGRTWLAIASH